MRPAAALVAALALWAPDAGAEPLRIASFNAELMRDGPGLLLRDLTRGGDAQIAAVVAVIARVDPDILILQGLDHDHGLAALSALADALAAQGVLYDTRLALPTNRGLATGLDMDGDGRTGTARDAQGYGRFYGQGAMAVLARFPVDRDAVQDFTTLLWADLPGALLPVTPEGTPFPSDAGRAVQRLSSSGHWVLPFQLPGGRLDVMAFHAGPPVFDGPEDANGRRNHDEILFWQRVLDGQVGTPPPGPFVIAGSANLDAQDSDGRREAIRALLADPRLQDPAPQSAGAAQAGAQGHAGPDALDSVDWPEVGRLRVDYVLPSAGLRVLGSGVFWPAPGEAGHEDALAASRHRLVWVDIDWP
ncbi:MAG: endonuclease/exonuclease/phosphatase family protein [Rhodobacteraceae bacterium]|nr:MAG: endonuclease/exonuclease/phosphatase family protein [Paracoccaceae bacterium]